MNKILLTAIFSIALISNSFSQITLTPTITNATCNGGCNGEISLLPLGGLPPYTYSWNTGDTAQDQFGLCPGNYSVTVSDALLVTITQSFIVGQPNPILSIQGFNASCPTSSDGSIVISVSGGIPPYSYLWSNGINVQSPVNLPVGTYFFTVTDADGCSSSGSETINSLSNLNVNTSQTNPSCGLADGSIIINPTNGVPPLSYTLGGGAPQGSNTFTGLAEGNYIIVVTDSVGCVVDKSIDLSEVKLTIDKVIPANCNNEKGEIRMKATGGTTPYTYAWSTGGGNVSIADSLAAGGYSVTVTDSAGCSNHKNIIVSLEPICVGYVSGKVFYDFDGDCILDTNEAPIQNAKIQVAGNGQFLVLSSDIEGYYEATLPLGTYIIEPFGGTAQNITCPASLKYQVNLVQAGTLVDGNDFAIQTVAYSDVSVTGTTSIARPGFQSDVYVTVINNSTVYGVASGQAKLTLDAKTNAVLASDTGLISGKVVTWNYYLSQGEQKTFHLKTQIIAPPTVNIGDVLMYEAKVIPATADSFSNNNIDSFGRVVQGSYDPNDKAVFPNGNILLKDTVLKYTIRFQNTGNDTAFTVIVRDTLDANLNPYTFRNFTASHPMTPVFVANNVIEFRFDQINLPDSFVNEPASNGFISFYINRIKNIPVGTVVKNQAAIYFDYNLPIFTNTTVNTIVNPISSIEELGNAAIKIYPNPVNEKLFNAVEDNQFESATLFDLNGAKVTENTAPELSVSGLPHGMYVCKVALKNAAVYYTKIIVE